MAATAAPAASSSTRAVGDDHALLEAVKGDMMLAMLGAVQGAAAACAEVCVQRLAAQHCEIMKVLEASDAATRESWTRVGGGCFLEGTAIRRGNALAPPLPRNALLHKLELVISESTGGGNEMPEEMRGASVESPLGELSAGAVSLEAMYENPWRLSSCTREAVDTNVQVAEGERTGGIVQDAIAAHLPGRPSTPSSLPAREALQRTPCSQQRTADARREPAALEALSSAEVGRVKESGKIGTIIVYDPADAQLNWKLQFDDHADWFREDAVEKVPLEESFKVLTNMAPACSAPADLLVLDSLIAGLNDDEKALHPHSSRSCSSVSVEPFSFGVAENTREAPHLTRAIEALVAAETQNVEALDISVEVDRDVVAPRGDTLLKGTRTEPEEEDSHVVRSAHAPIEDELAETVPCISLELSALKAAQEPATNAVDLTRRTATKVAVEDLATKVATALGGFAGVGLDEASGGVDSPPRRQGDVAELLPGTGGTDENIHVEAVSILAHTCRERAKRVMELSRAAHRECGNDDSGEDLWQAIDKEYDAIMNRWSSLSPLLDCANEKL